MIIKVINVMLLDPNITFHDSTLIMVVFVWMIIKVINVILLDPNITFHECTLMMIVLYLDEHQSHQSHQSHVI